MAEIGRLVLLVGVGLVLIGGLQMLAGRLGLPGDIVIHRGRLTIFIPLASGLILSVALTIALNLYLRSR